MTTLSVSMILRAIDKASKPIKAVKEAMTGTSEEAQRLAAVNRGLSKSTDKTAASVWRLSKVLGILSRSTGAGPALSATARGVAQLGAVAGAMSGAGLLGFSFGLVKAGMQYEEFMSVLEGTERSAAGAQRAMKMIRSFAATTPYEVDDVTQAFVQMRAYGLDASTKALTAMGDLASTRSGKTMIDVVEAVSDGMMGEFIRLKEFGVTASKKGSQVLLDYGTATGRLTRAVKADAASIEKALYEVFDQMAGGTMKRRSNDLGSILGNVKDKWRDFLLMVGGGGVIGGKGGVYDWIRTRAERFLKFLNSNDGAKFAKQLSDSLIKAFTVIETALLKVDFGKLVVDIAKIVSAVADVVSWMGGLGGVVDWVFGGLLVNAGISVGTFFAALAAGAGLATAPVWGVVAAVVGAIAAAWALWRHWDEVTALIGDAWRGLAGWASEAWESVFGAVVAGVQKIAKWLGANWRLLVPAPLMQFLQIGANLASLGSRGDDPPLLAQATAVDLGRVRPARAAGRDRLEGRIEVALTGPGASQARVGRVETSGPGIDLRASRGLRLSAF